MSADRSGIVIVGANLTGGAAATTLRSEGFDGTVVLIGEETHPPYERPPLSKEYPRGERPAETALLRPESWYDDHDVDLRLGVRADRLEPAAAVIRLEDGTEVPYGRVLVATGGRNRWIRVPGSDLAGIHYLRTI